MMPFAIIGRFPLGNGLLRLVPASARCCAIPASVRCAFHDPPLRAARQLIQLRPTPTGSRGPLKFAPFPNAEGSEVRARSVLAVAISTGSPPLNLVRSRVRQMQFESVQFSAVGTLQRPQEEWADPVSLAAAGDVLRTQIPVHCSTGRVGTGKAQTLSGPGGTTKNASLRAERAVTYRAKVSLAVSRNSNCGGSASSLASLTERIGVSSSRFI